MKFQSTILSEARGKLNGAVFSRNRYAAIIRNKTSPVNPQTSAQALQRQNFAALSASFRGLTPEQITGWNEAAANFGRTNVFGQTYYQTGLNLYVGLNTNLLNANASEISDAPTPVEMPVLEIGAITNSDVAQTIAFTPTPVPTDHALLIFATAPVSAGRNFLKNRYRLISVVTASGASPANTFAAYSAKFGAPIPGMRIGFKLMLVNTATGQAGLPVLGSSITTS